jgi:hypothetical protein
LRPVVTATVRKAETIMQIIYPEANVFDSYNVVNENQDPTKFRVS